MARQLVADASTAEFVEDGLAEMGELRHFIVKNLRLLEMLNGLGHADEIQVANARKRVEAARADLRAAEETLAEAEENEAQASEIREEIIKAFHVEQATLGTVTRLMSESAAKLGVRHMRSVRAALPECSPSEKALV